MATKYFCYCIGGTGARIAEAAAHLCAMNMVNGNEDITFIIVDKDKECGGTTQATATIRNISALSGLPKSDRPKGSEVSFCKNNIENNNWNFSDALGELTGGDDDATLDKTLNTDNSDKLVMKAFFDETKRESDTKKGFYGNPAIGAAIFKAMIGNNKTIIDPVREHLQCDGNTAKVFIIGSIFGGTGAAVFSNLAALIRNSFTDKADKLFISGVLLLQYFGFGKGSSQDNTIDIESSTFDGKSCIALQQYAENEHLMRKAVNGEENGNFDSLYICGQSELHIVGEYANGGSGQINHFTLVDLIAADAMIDFFNKNFNGANGITGLGKIYEYRFKSTGDNGKITKIGIEDIGDLADNLTKMLRFVVFVIARFITQFTYSDKKYGVTGNGDGGNREEMYGRVQAFRDIYHNEKEFKKIDFSKICTETRTFINPLLRYCTDYIRLIYDISKTGYNWSNDKETVEESQYELFDKAYIECINNICSLLNSSNLDVDSLTEKADELDGIEAKLAIPWSVKEVLAQLQCTFKDVEYNGSDSFETRLGDYIHEAMRICFS